MFEVLKGRFWQEDETPEVFSYRDVADQREGTLERAVGRLADLFPAFFIEATPEPPVQTDTVVTSEQLRNSVPVETGNVVPPSPEVSEHQAATEQTDEGLPNQSVVNRNLQRIFDDQENISR